MMQGRSAPSIADHGDAPLIERVMETDRAYFELGAETKRLPGATLAWMPGLARYPAAAVIYRVDAEVVEARGAQWVVDAEASLAEIGARLARIYVDRRGTGADDVLRAAGYADRDEIAFVHEFPEPSSVVALSPVRTEADWRRKLALHEAAEGPPDGHFIEANDHVTLERAKCAHGMEMFLAEYKGEAVATAGLIPGEGVLRIKNIVVHPDHRRQRFGASILANIAAIGRARGLPTLCLFALAGEPGELLYRAVGMRIAGTQVEWSRPLERQSR
jgi:ribosomal protein S18 acetylase RimI-like enzyme